MLDPDLSTADALRLLSARDDDPAGSSRRRFLQLVGAGLGIGALSTGLDAVLGDDRAWSAAPVRPSEGILVVIGMYGGNDGLNTVVPLDDADYQRYRPAALRVAPSATLPLASGYGLHPKLGVLKQLWDQQLLAVVHGIGYPTPDLSHFNSMATWMSGIRTGVPSTGWIGRWLDGRFATPNLYAAASVGSSVPLHMIGAQRRATAVAEGKPSFGGHPDPAYQRMYRAVRELAAPGKGTLRDAVTGALRDQVDIAQRITPIMPTTPPTVEIVAKLGAAARLINADLGFRVIEVSWGDFDSHRGQPAMHEQRMVEFDAAVREFYRLLLARWSNNVTLMTFSEFGRTVWSNDSDGTDHGTANCAFVFGSNVRGGLYGQPASLVDLDRWERMTHNVDFRSYYASLLDGWLGGGSSDVLGGRFENLGLFKGEPGTPAGTVRIV